MRIGTFLAALLALGSWTFVVSGQASAHGGTDLAVFDCEDEECEGDQATLDCENGDGDGSAAVLECHDEEDQE